MRAAYVVLVMAGMWLTEAIPIPATALLPIFLFPMAGVQVAKDVSKSYISVSLVACLSSDGQLGGRKNYSGSPVYNYDRFMIIIMTALNDAKTCSLPLLHHQLFPSGVPDVISFMTSCLKLNCRAFQM